MAGAQQARYEVGDTVTIECDSEFELSADLQSNILTCQVDGEWSFNHFDKICIKTKRKNNNHDKCQVQQ